MKVIVASTVVPFEEGGATLIVSWLAEVLKQQGHTVDTLLLPFTTRLPEMLDQMLALRLLDITGHGDRLITIRTPSYLLRHPRKVLWFIHHHRSAYDLWRTQYCDIPSSPEGLAYRSAIRRADQVAFQEAAKIFTNSEIVARRLRQYNGVEAPVLYPPLYRPERYHNAGYGDYILYISRLNRHKRQWLALEALRHTRTPVRLAIVGKADAVEDAYADELRAAIRTYDLGERVMLVTDWVSEDEKVELFANCRAAIYMPYDEDSYGYPTLEAHHAGKAVITTTDSGGTQELIVNGENGFVTPPDPEAIAAAMDRLYESAPLAESLGKAGVERIQKLRISWPAVIENLLS
jgi:glycosyltransferase involved in cell wall biosynthesis